VGPVGTNDGAGMGTVILTLINVMPSLQSDQMSKEMLMQMLREMTNTEALQ